VKIRKETNRIKRRVDGDGTEGEGEENRKNGGKRKKFRI
jgi:hypothetical protein